MSTDPLSRLNPLQREAASHGDGCALVLAGPGTGKTTTMVGRYAHLLSQGVRPEEILVATFTKKAADEMHDRISAATELDLSGQPIGTFHSICLRILGGAAVIDRAQRFAVIRKIAPRWKGEFEDLLDQIDRWKDSLISPQKAARIARSASPLDRSTAEECARAYAAYQEVLKAQGLHDFGDLIELTIQSLRGATQGERPMWRYVMVDEYQDINLAQDTLISELIAGNGNLWVVGDDDQAIYGWRGSEIRYITGFSNRYRSASVYRLRENYRSTLVILRAAASLIEHNRERLPKVLVPACSGGAPICFHSSQDDWAEARWVVESVRKYLAKTPEGDAAVLVRTNSQTAAFEGQLDLAGIPYTIQGAQGFWTLPSVGAILAGLQRHLGRNSSWKGLDYIQHPIDRALDRKGSLAERVRTAAAAIEAKIPKGMRKENVDEWVTSAHQLADMAMNFADASSFLDYASQQHRTGQSSSGSVRVTVSTIHQAKGLEWDAVFVCGCEEGILPHASAPDLSEERRLAFVAATRAKRYLTFSWAESRGGQPTSRSRFVAEARRGLAEEQIDDRSSAVGARPRRFKSSKSQRSKPGSHAAVVTRHSSTAAKVHCVEHPQYGVGRVISIGQDVWHVRFARFGVKEVPGRSVCLIDGSC